MHENTQAPGHKTVSNKGEHKSFFTGRIRFQFSNKVCGWVGGRGGAATEKRVKVCVCVCVREREGGGERVHARVLTSQVRSWSGQTTVRQMAMMRTQSGRVRGSEQGGREMRCDECKERERERQTDRQRERER